MRRQLSAWASLVSWVHTYMCTLTLVILTNPGENPGLALVILTLTLVPILELPTQR